MFVRVVFLQFILPVLIQLVIVAEASVSPEARIPPVPQVVEVPSTSPVFIHFVITKFPLADCIYPATPPAY